MIELFCLHELDGWMNLESLEMLLYLELGYVEYYCRIVTSHLTSLGVGRLVLMTVLHVHTNIKISNMSFIAEIVFDLNQIIMIYIYG